MGRVGGEAGGEGWGRGLYLRHSAARRRKVLSKFTKINTLEHIFSMESYGDGMLYETA